MNLNRMTPLISAALLVFLGGVAQITYGQASQAGGNDCSLVTPAMLNKTLGQPMTRKPDAQKALPMYGGAPGWTCTYVVGAQNQEVDVQFAVYTEASAAKARQDFEKYAVAANDARGKPSIGDGAYWVEATKKTVILYVLKGKVHFSIQMRPSNEKQLTELAAAVAATI